MKRSFLPNFNFFCDETLQVQNQCILFAGKLHRKTVCPVLLDVSITFPYSHKLCNFRVEAKIYQPLFTTL